MDEQHRQKMRWRKKCQHTHTKRRREIEWKSAQTNKGCREIEEEKKTVQISNKMQKICFSNSPMLMWLWIFNDSTINVDGTQRMQCLNVFVTKPNSLHSFCSRFRFGMCTTDGYCNMQLLWLLHSGNSNSRAAAHISCTDKWQWNSTTWYYVAYYLPQSKLNQQPRTSANANEAIPTISIQ